MASPFGQLKTSPIEFMGATLGFPQSVEDMKCLAHWSVNAKVSWSFDITLLSLSDLRINLNSSMDFVVEQRFQNSGLQNIP